MGISVGTVTRHEILMRIVFIMQGLCEEGEGGKFVDRGDNTYGGKYVVNPSGGLISKGHPLGATGLAQCAELNWQVLMPFSSINFCLA